MKTRKLVYKTDPIDGSNQNGPYRSEIEDAADSDIILMHPSGTAGLTADGGVAVRMINKTGASSVKGTYIRPAGTYTSGFTLGGTAGSLTSSFDCIGVVYQDSVADGGYCWVTVAGVAKVLTNGRITNGDWLYPMGNGRVSGAFGPTGVNSIAQDLHFQEHGHAIESTAASGSDVLVKAVIHFN